MATTCAEAPVIMETLVMRDARLYISFDMGLWRFFSSESKSEVIILWAVFFCVSPSHCYHLCICYFCLDVGTMPINSRMHWSKGITKQHRYLKALEVGLTFSKNLQTCDMISRVFKNLIPFDCIFCCLRMKCIRILPEQELLQETSTVHHIPFQNQKRIWNCMK